MKHLDHSNRVRLVWVRISTSSRISSYTRIVRLLALKLGHRIHHPENQAVAAGGVIVICCRHFYPLRLLNGSLKGTSTKRLTRGRGFDPLCPLLLLLLLLSACSSVICVRTAEKIDMQEQQIRQLEHHAAQLKDSLKASGIISQSVTSTEGVTAVGVVEEEVEVSHQGGQGADGDLP